MIARSAAEVGPGRWKAGERTVSGLSLIGTFVDLFRPNECANYFSSCGYDPD
jgi:hypothetical protein